MIRRNKVLFDAATASSGDWVKLDSRYEEDASRAVHGTVTTGDTVTVEGTTLDKKDAAALSAVVTASDIATLKEFTANFADVLLGNWTFIRVTKTGTAGASKVQGYV